MFSHFKTEDSYGSRFDVSSSDLGLFPLAVLSWEVSYSRRLEWETESFISRKPTPKRQKEPETVVSIFLCQILQKNKTQNQSIT